MEPLDKFKAFVRELSLSNNANEFLEELYNMLFEKDDYDVFETTYAARCWLVEKLREAHEAQWNSKCFLIRKCIRELDSLDPAPALIEGLTRSLDRRLREADLSLVKDKNSAIALFESMLVRIRADNE